MKRLLLTTVLLLSAATAYAANDTSAATSGNNNDVNQINGNNNVLSTGAGAFGSSSNVSSTNVNTAVGGTGGSATARSGDSNSAVIGSGNSSIRDSGNSRSTSSASQGQFQTQNSSVRDSGNSANTNSVNVAAQKRNPVSTAYSGPLVAADDTCMGSTSAGAQAIGFGLSVGSTWQDPDCVRRKDARELHNMGLKDVGVALMCQNANVRKAMAATGHFCPDGEVDDLIGLPVVEAPTNASRNR